MKVGDRIKTWFSGKEDGLSEILSMRKQDGLYGGNTHIVRLSAPRTMRGWMELTLNETDVDRELSYRLKEASQ